jgi:hypothetical protein
MSTLQRNKAVLAEKRAIHWHSKRVGLLCHDEESGKEFWNTLEDMRESILDHEGQFISLDLAEPSTETFLEKFYAALKNTCLERSLQFTLPIILQHNPHIATPFLNHAILWQRLCDLMIVDDDPNRETLLVLENADHASPVVQHEIARLIRFHTAHSIHRTFVFTLNRHSHEQITPELREILGIR